MKFQIYLSQQPFQTFDLVFRWQEFTTRTVKEKMREIVLPSRHNLGLFTLACMVSSETHCDQSRKVLSFQWVRRLKIKLINNNKLIIFVFVITHRLPQFSKIRSQAKIIDLRWMFYLLLTFCLGDAIMERIQVPLFRELNLRPHAGSLCGALEPAHEKTVIQLNGKQTENDHYSESSLVGIINGYWQMLMGKIANVYLP